MSKIERLLARLQEIEQEILAAKDAKALDALAARNQIAEALSPPLAVWAQRHAEVVAKYDQIANPEKGGGR